MKRYSILFSVLALASLLMPPQPTFAAETEEKQKGPLEMRVDQIVAIFRGDMAPEDFFHERFLTAIPADQFNAITANLIAQYGQPVEVLQIDRVSEETAIIKLAFEKAVGTINISIDANAPHKVNGLLATGFLVMADSMDKIEADFAALPGNSGYIIAQLYDDTDYKIIAGRNIGTQFAIGSTFKLYILAELAAQVDAGERSWAEVVPLSQRSFSSPATKNWPRNSPVTLKTLAIQMISASDNSATDTLLHVLGRSAVEQKLATIGHSDPDKALPFLSTVEAFALKSPVNMDLREHYLSANEAEQRKIIEQEQDKLGIDQVDPNSFTGGPVHIDTIEWFASPADITNLMNNIRRSRNNDMMEIMAINSGIGPDDAAKWDYLGYKGGSEPGVISMSFLLRSKDGKWITISGSWNDGENPVQQSTLFSLLSRLINQVAMSIRFEEENQSQKPDE